MKKTFCVILTVLICAACLNTVYAADEKATWQENSLSLVIFEPGTIDETKYTAEIKNKFSEYLEPSGNLHVLMYNGGFVPRANIIIRNDRALVSLDALAPLPGFDLVYKAETNEIVGTINNRVFQLFIGSGEIKVYGVSYPIPTAPEFIGSSVYVPIRILAEFAGMKIDYSQLGYRQRSAAAQVSVISICDNIQVVSKAKATQIVLDESKITYEEVKSYLEESGEGFTIHADYDWSSISYMGVSFMRYHCFELKGFEDFPIYVNMVTGEIFSQNAGLPFICLSPGFPNIPWMYQ